MQHAHALVEALARVFCPPRLSELVEFPDGAMRKKSSMFVL